MTISAHDAAKKSRELAALAPVIPVIVIKDVAYARPLAEALVAGGLPVLEVTLRTPQALEAIQLMSDVKGGFVGAGTVLNTKDAAAARAAGATFAVSPGSTPGVFEACENNDLPLLPGVSTPTEAMAALERGYDMLKFFPAEANGGLPVLKAWYGPLPQISFCPTGGVSPSNAEAYLASPNVVCVGGSWVVSETLMANGEWDKIEAAARQAAALSR